MNTALFALAVAGAAVVVEFGVVALVLLFGGDRDSVLGF